MSGDFGYLYKKMVEVFIGGVVERVCSFVCWILWSRFEGFLYGGSYLSFLEKVFLSL